MLLDGFGLKPVVEVLGVWVEVTMRVDVMTEPLEVIGTSLVMVVGVGVGVGVGEVGVLGGGVGGLLGGFEQDEP